MKIVSGEHGASIAMGKTGRAGTWEQAEKQEKKQEKKQEGSIFAGDLNRMGDDITQKRREAMRKAMKVLSDQFGRDGEIDEGMAESRQHIANSKERMKSANESVKELQAEKNALREAHGVAADSQEQQDLELIERAQRARKEGSLDSLSTEELTRVSQMGPLTDYQREALHVTTMQNVYRAQISKEQGTIQGETQALVSTKQALLGREYDMSDAARDSTEMQKQAAKEIVGMLTSEAKEHIDEEFEKLQEEAAKRAEEKQKQEEALEEIRRKEQESAEQIDAVSEKAKETAAAEEQMTEMIAQMQKLGKEQELLTEDRKGLVTDQFL